MMQEEEQLDDNSVNVNVDVDNMMARLLYSGLDGGVILVAVHGNVITSSRREGRARLWMVMAKNIGMTALG